MKRIHVIAISAGAVLVVAGVILVQSLGSDEAVARDDKTQHQTKKSQAPRSWLGFAKKGAETEQGSPAEAEGNLRRLSKEEVDPSLDRFDYDIAFEYTGPRAAAAPAPSAQASAEPPEEEEEEAKEAPIPRTFEEKRAALVELDPSLAPMMEAQERRIAKEREEFEATGLTTRERARLRLPAKHDDE
jgi:hypothetical protein